MVAGEVVFLYAFDVANEIRVGEVAELLSTRPVRYTVRADRPAPKSVPIYRPLAIEPPPPAVGMGGRPVRLLVRVYEIGVVNVSARVAFTPAALTDLLPFHDPKLDDGRSLDQLARDLCRDVCRDLAGALVKPDEMTEPEAYTAFRLTDLGGERDTWTWLAANGPAVAGLLSDTDPARLSEQHVAEVLRLKRSFEATDLVVIDWDAALVVDLTADAEDVLFVLELANLQLEEFRWIDRTLDQRLDRVYAALERPARVPGVGSALRELWRLRIDLTRLTDEVTHITKFIGDWHLAWVHRLARERFHLDQWRASVDQRLSQLDQLYTLAAGERYNRRMLVLELVIVALFVADLLALVLVRH
jgi:hypothetical protein